MAVDPVSSREALMMADVLVHEVYEAESGSSQGTSFVPTEVELENYTKLLNNPGEVQPHGCFFLVDEANGPLNIIAASTNTDEIFGVHHSACMGKPLGDLLQGGSAPLLNALDQADLSFANPVSVQARTPPPPPKQNAFNFILHRSPSGILVDVEPYDPMENSFAFHQRVRFAIERLNNTPSMDALYPQVADEIFSTTGYTRVMVYKFHEDMHGEVVAECKRKDEDPEWMGLHFPATDVPQRTRDQLRRELVRMIGDAKATHVPIATDGSMKPEGINLMGSTLRSAHHCHLQYLQNMGTRASLAFAVVVKEQLWGLVVCHSAVAKTVSFQLRMAGEFLVQALAMRLSNLMDLENHVIQDRILKTHAKLCDFMYQQGHNPGLRVKGLLNNTPNLLDLLPNVDGAVVQFAGKVQAIGRAPAQPILQQFCTWVHQGWQEEGGRVIRAYNTIKGLPDELFQQLQGLWGGMLVTPLGMDGLMIFFRPQLSESMRWGGNPNEAARRKGEVMHPRGSFEIFTDSVKDQCQPWLKWEMEAASGLCALVKDILESADADEVRSNVLVRLNQERMQYHSDKEAVVSEMTALMESVKAPVMAVDQWGMLLQWNSMMEDLTKHNKDSVLGRPLDNFVTEAHRHVLKNLIRDAIAHVDASNVELSILKANSANLPVGQRRVDLKVSTSGRFNPSGACTSVVFVGHANTAKGKEGELEEQLEAVVQMTAPAGTASAFTEDSEGNYEWYPDKDSSLLGEGSFGKTHKMKGKIDGQLYAVKMINVKKAEKNGVQLAALKKEVQMLMMLNSPHVIRYFTCYMFKKDKFFCIVMELVEGGTLGDLIEDTRGTVNRIPPEKVLMYTIQITKALAHIHSKKMLHRDIKPHNILLSEDGSESKVTDFGFACVMSSAAAASRAGTLTYSSPEKAGAKGYNSKDDMWALGCIISELVTGTSMTARCGGGIFAFNMPLIARTIEQVRSINEHMGRHVAALLSIDPAKRPSPTELLAALEPGPSPGVQADDAEELCEEYMCAICQNLVLDATTVCNDEHVFCSSCLQVWLDTKNECPTCRKPALEPHRLRIINNAVEKLATRLLSATALNDRNERKAQLLADEEEKRRKQAEQHKREEEARRAEDARMRRQSGEQGEEQGEEQGVSACWKYAQAEVHYGAGCTLLRHTASGSVVEVFHSNGWYRFRAQPGEGTRWCNSCGNIGESEFGAQDVVQSLDGGGGQEVPTVGLGMLDDSAYWECRVSGAYLVLSNSDDEEMYLDKLGGFVWLSHPGMNKAVIARDGSVQTSTRTEAEGLLRQ